MGRVVHPLQSMGARIDGMDGGERLPLAVRGARLSGGECVPSAASAQVKTAVLLAGLSASGSTTIREPLATRDHTERMLSFLQVPLLKDKNSVTIYPCSEIPGGSWTVPGDFSAAAFWIVAGAISSERGLEIRDTGVNPTRTGLLKVLERMGAVPEIRNVRQWGGEEVADLRIGKAHMVATRVEAEEVPLLVDELPLVALAATQADGVTEISGAGELRVKECDRIHTVAKGLAALGADIAEKEDGWIIKGPTPLSGGRVSTKGDHRMVMTFSIASLVTKGEAILEETESAGVSDPAFLRELNRIAGGNVA
jgi:3-phosphoshikimate 1-carboxyvinyltransferase